MGGTDELERFRPLPSEFLQGSTTDVDSDQRRDDGVRGGDGQIFWWGRRRDF